MLLKRSIVLAGGVLLFIAAFIIYFDVSHAQMEARFRAEREKFHVDHLVMTAAGPANPTTTPAAPAPAPSPSAAPDTNALVAPVPPPSSSAPDNTPVPAAAPDTNSAPAPPPSSTMDYPRTSRSPFLILASYRPSDGVKIQMTDTPTGAVASPPAPPVTNPAINTSPTPAPADTNATPTATTNASPVASPTVESGGARPVVGEASVIVLLYHQFKPEGVPIPAKFQWTMNQDVFESEMKYIHDNGYHVVPLSDVLRFIKHKITLPPGSVCITIDDGYKSAIDYAAPILKKYGYPWTFFIYPEFITVNEGSGAASWKDLLELQAEGVDIESHSMTHPQLTRHHQKVKNVWHNFTPEEYAAWLTNETIGSKALLEQKMGKPITCFAYPFGDYNKQVEAAVIAAGYEAILTVADNPVQSTTNMHSIGRYTITQGVIKNFPAYLRQSALGLTKTDPEPGATVTNPRPVITAVLEPLGAGRIDPTSLETSVRDFGVVRHDFDPQTNTVRLYLPRDLIQQINLVNIRAKDVATGQFMVANWHFNYEPGPNASHPPIAPATNFPSALTKAPVTKTTALATNSPSASTKAPAPPSPSTASATTNAPEPAKPESLKKSAVGIPLAAPQAPPVSPD